MRIVCESWQPFESSYRNQNIRIYWNNPPRCQFIWPSCCLSTHNKVQSRYIKNDTTHGQLLFKQSGTEMKCFHEFVLNFPIFPNPTLCHGEIQHLKNVQNCCGFEWNHFFHSGEFVTRNPSNNPRCLRDLFKYTFLYFCSRGGVHHVFAE